MYVAGWSGVGLFDLPMADNCEKQTVNEPIPEHRNDVPKTSFFDGRSKVPTVFSSVRGAVSRKIGWGEKGGRALGWFRRQWVFSVVVLLPTAVVAFYLWFLASPQYISETHFLVQGKSINAPAMGGLGSLLESGHGGSQDTYAVQDYMMSRDALKMLIEKADLRGVFNSPFADFWAKFPSLFSRNDFEDFYAYYRRHIKAQIDEETGISHLKVRTFSAADSRHIAQILLDAGERLVNEMNNRQRYNILHAAQIELEASLKELHDTEMQLAFYRYRNEVIDPMKQAMPMVGTAVSLEMAISAMEAEKKQLESTAPYSPLIKVYGQRIDSMKVQLKGMRAHMVGQRGEGGDISLVPKLLGYDELEIRKGLIEKKILAETSSLEVAKAQADRQMLYVTVVAQPSLPDYAEYPRDLIVLLITFVSSLMVYATGALLVSGAREHALQ